MDVIGDYMRQNKPDLEKYHMFSFIGVVVMVEVLMVVCVMFHGNTKKMMWGEEEILMEVVGGKLWMVESVWNECLK